MTHDPAGPRRPGTPGQPEDPRTGPPRVNAWIPSLATVLDKQQKTTTSTAPPAGATGLTSLGTLPAPGTQPAGQPPRPSLYGARAIGPAIPEFVMPAPRRRRRRGRNNALILLLVLVVLAVGGGAGYWYLNRDTHAGDAATEGRIFALPAAVAGYHRLAVGSNTGTMFKAQLTSSFSPQMAAHMQSGEYGGRHLPNVLVLAFRPKDSSQLYNEMLDDGVAPSVDRAALGISNGVTNALHESPVLPQRVDPGLKGGAMSCVALPVKSHTLSSCVWADRSYLAVTIVVDAPSLDSTAQVAREVREAAEH